MINQSILRLVQSLETLMLLIILVGLVFLDCNNQITELL